MKGVPDNVIPAAFAELLTNRPSDGVVDGTRWLRRLPGLIVELLSQWDLEITGSSRHGECAVVIPVRRDSAAAVLKIGWPHREAEHEALALKHWTSTGACVGLLAADPSRWALLLEPADADRDLANVPIEPACTVIGGLLARIRRPALPQLVPLSQLATRIRESVATLDTIPRRFVQQARALCAELIADPAVDSSTLHTDLHYANVLSAQREPWLVIDPKPIAGDPAFEVAPALWNRWEEVVAARHPRDELRARLGWICAAGGIDEDRAKAWTIVREVQNAAWVGAPTSVGSADRLTAAVTILKAMQD